MTISKIVNNFIILLFLLTVPEISFAETVGGTAFYGKNYNYFQTTGNGVTDMLACYEAQLEKSGSDLGLYSGWCENILIDCAYLTGQIGAIGTFLNHGTEIIKRGGYEVDKSQIQAGDILIYTDHVGIAVDYNVSLHGNVNDKVQKLCTWGWQYCDLNKGLSESGVASFEKVIRPNYTTSPGGLKLAAGLKEIQDSAFEGSNSILQVTIPDGVTTIGSRAFANCTNLTLVNIPSSVTSIDADAFLNDSNLTLLCQGNSRCWTHAVFFGLRYREQ